MERLPEEIQMLKKKKRGEIKAVVLDVLCKKVF